MQKLLIDSHFLLQKFPGKGGWTYAEIPDVSQHRKTGFGWMKVSGTVDGFAIKDYNLAPMGQGRMFLPVKAEIRKAIKKEEGDTVHIVLYADIEPISAEDDFEICLADEPKAQKFYQSLTAAEKISTKTWVNSAKNSDIKVERIAKVIDYFLMGKKVNV
jgi:hypothetical protein